MQSALITKKDLDQIISNAKINMTNLRLPMTISHKEVEMGELPSVAIIEAVLSHLTSHKLLTEHVKLEYTETTFESDDY